MPLEGAKYLGLREGGGSSVAFATLTKDGWRTGSLARAEEIIVSRRGIWDKMFEGRVIPMVEQLGWPVLFRDGLNFTRVKNGERTLPVGPPGSWDSGFVFHAPSVRDGDNLRVYYEGCTCHHGTDGAYPAIEAGLATIRVNGWTCYTSKPDGCGTVTTIPIQAPAGVRKGLTVNIDGAAGLAGAFAVEVLDAATREPIEGFSAAECAGPASDGLAVPVTWKAGRALPVGREIRLRFHLRARGVRLYSFGFQAVGA